MSYLDLLFDEKRKECTEAGEHKNPVWFNYIITNRSSFRDEQRGMCLHCLTGLKKPLEDYQIKQIEDFRKSLYQPMTI